MSLNIQNVKALKHKYPVSYNNIPIGATVRAAVKVVEGKRARNQIFEGVLIRRHKGVDVSTVTIRKISFGVAVEKIINLDSPHLVSLEAVAFHQVRQSRLYFLRNRRGNAAKLSAIYGISQEELLSRVAGKSEEDAAAQADTAEAKAKNADDASPKTENVEVKAEAQPSETSEGAKAEAQKTETKSAEAQPAKVDTAKDSAPADADKTKAQKSAAKKES